VSAVVEVRDAPQGVVPAWADSRLADPCPPVTEICRTPTEETPAVTAVVGVRDAPQGVVPASAGCRLADPCPLATEVCHTSTREARP